MEEKKMYEFELMYALSTEGTNDEERKSYSDRFRELVEKDGGTVHKVDSWGIKRLCFEIADQSKADYYLLTFTASRDVIPALDRRLKQESQVLRHMIIRKED